MMKLIVVLLLCSITYTQAQDIPISQYFSILCHARQNQFAIRDDGNFDALCQQYGLDPKDSINLRNYYTISILHQMFTCRDCSDGSRGTILNIPYFWHYRTPNPRHAILVDGIRNTKYTGIERKPHFFLADMVAAKERFYHPQYGSFSTFGWCSEREMAFACLLSLMGYDAHVIAPGNHAWTEVEMPFHTTGGTDTTLVVSIDNTFNGITYSPDPPSGHNNVYNRMAFASEEVAKTRALTVPLSARVRIDQALSTYLTGQ